MEAPSPRHDGTCIQIRDCLTLPFQNDALVHLIPMMSPRSWQASTTLTMEARVCQGPGSEILHNPRRPLAPHAGCCQGWLHRTRERPASLFVDTARTLAHDEGGRTSTGAASRTTAIGVTTGAAVLGAACLTAAIGATTLTAAIGLVPR